MRGVGAPVAQLRGGVIALAGLRSFSGDADA
jgi:hypothetical protein